MKYVVAALAVLALTTVSPRAQTARPAAAVAEKPKLVVLISIDQMRGDYVDRFRHQWTKGLHRLVTEGAWFRQADYPYFTTVTCAGHASISTGTVPAVHGMISNTWADRNNSRTVSCTDDETQKLVSYGAPASGVAHSAANLMTPTLADEMRSQMWPPPRVVGISLKARSAINLSGHKPDVVIWLDERDGEWVTSTAFAKSPAPFLQEYIAKNPIREQMNLTWDRTFAQDQYLFSGTSEFFRAGRTGFPHSLKPRGGEVGGVATDPWEASPFSDAYLNALAFTAIDSMKLGRTAGTDFLAISYSALDLTGHTYGPMSHEVQDVLIQLDRQIGLLLDKLDRDIGKGNYLIGLSADHGVAPIPEQMKAEGFDAGRVDTAGLGKLIDSILARELGAGAYRTRVINNDVYFNDGVYAKLTQAPNAMEAVVDAIRKFDGILRVYRKEQLSPTDPMTRQSFLSLYPGRSGDIKIIPRVYWITSSNTATHGTGYRYDAHVPVILFGFGIKKGEYPEASSPLDLAPTLAFLSNVTLPNAMGRVLTEALTRH